MEMPEHLTQQDTAVIVVWGNIVFSSVFNGPYSWPFEQRYEKKTVPGQETCNKTVVSLESFFSLHPFSPMEHDESDRFPQLVQIICPPGPCFSRSVPKVDDLSGIDRVFSCPVPKCRHTYRYTFSLLRPADFLFSFHSDTRAISRCTSRPNIPTTSTCCR